MPRPVSLTYTPIGAAAGAPGRDKTGLPHIHGGNVQAINKFIDRITDLFAKFAALVLGYHGGGGIFESLNGWQLIS